MRNAGPLLVVLAFALFGGCSRRHGFCPQNLSGTWATRDQSTSYAVEDRGDAVGIRVNSSTATLRRTDDALSGTMQTPSGKCSVDIAVQVTSCRPNDFVLHREEDPALDADCKRRTTQPDGSPVLHRLRELTLYRAKR